MNNEDMMTRRDQSSEPMNGRHRPVAPPCDVYENADEYLIVADIPGAEERTVDIKHERSKLTIEARRTNERHGTVVEAEPQPSSYMRTFQVPETVDVEQIRAELKHGVLHLHLPKGPQARVRKIAVTAG
jgi:HSP20 family molecular chaperone IbpA